MKVKYNSLLMISENLQSLYSQGIDIVTSLELIEELSIGKTYKKSIGEIKKNILEGEELYKAFEKQDKLFPKIFISLMCIGETTGNLSITLKSLSDYFSKRIKIKKELSSVIIMPIFIILIMVTSLNIFLFIIIPFISENIMNINGENSSIYKICNFRNWVLINSKFIFMDLCIGAIFLVCFIYIIRKKFLLKSNFLIKINIIKNYYENIIILILKIIFESGISVYKGINIACDSFEQKYIKNEFKSMGKKLGEGKDIYDAIKNSKILSKRSKLLIKVGEYGGYLNEALESISINLERNLNSSVDKLIKRIQPATTIILAIMVCLFIIIVILPIMDSVNDIGL